MQKRKDNENVDLYEAVNVAKNIAKKAGKLLNDYFKKDFSVYEKGERDIVTEADEKVENFIKNEIKSYYSEHSILAEESGMENKKSKYIWIIDPLDGTTNFTHHIPFFNISIALKEHEKTLLGVVYNPLLDELFYAYEDKAFLNEKIIRPRENNELKKALIGCCHSNDKKAIRRFLSLLKMLKPKVRDVRKFGSGALEICYVACGRLDAFISFDAKVWDIEAGLLIAKNSGCNVIENLNDEQGNVFVSSPSMFDKLTTLIKKIK